MKYKHFILLLMCAASLSANATIGQWQTYISYTDVQTVTQSPNKVFVVSSGALFSYNKQDQSIEIYSKLTGLTDNDISFVDYSDENETLFIIYKNSNIDLITSQGVFNLPDLKNKSIAGSKVVNSIVFKDGFAYLATDLGILKINVKKKEFTDTYIIGENGTNLAVKAVTIQNDSIFACVENRMLAADVNGNLSDFHNWNSSTLPDNAVKNKNMIHFEGKTYLLKADSTVYVKSGQSWLPYDIDVVSVNESKNRLNFIKNTTITTLFNGVSTIKSIPVPFSMGICDESGTYYLAAQSKGLGVMTPATEMSFYLPDGPVTNDTFIAKFRGGKLFVITSGPFVSETNSRTAAAVMIYDGNKWIGITNDDIPAADGEFVNTLNFDVDANDSEHFFVGVYHKGLYEFRENKFFTRYNKFNSPVEGAANNTDDSQLINGVTYDKKGNLWLTQPSIALNSLLVLKADGTWKSFYFENISKRIDIQNILVDDNNYKWINLRDGGIFVLNDKGTIDDTSDDTFVTHLQFIDQDGNLFNPTSLRHLVEDKSDSKKIWLATSNGPVIISNPRNVFNSNNITRIKIPRNDGSSLADYLLENETVNWIAVDGANRKWLATRTSGAYLVSENGTEMIHHFTTENSPLLSDNIYSIDINPETGEVFFATTNGLISYRGDATEGKTSFSDAYAFPNPVREDYHGVITIAGLMEKTNVKITDVAGNLIYETTSAGGMAIWDGTNVTGQRVSTGVYLALCSTENASERAVVKILIINH